MLIGSLWLCIPIVGWVLNMGHRIVVVHHLIHGDIQPWPAWGNLRELLRHGVITLAGMLLYLLPAAITGCVAYLLWSWAIGIIAGVFFVIGICAIPGYMTAYCAQFDHREVFNIRRSLQRVVHAGPAYWKAWGITLVALAGSFFGLLGFGVLFLFTSVWFWQAAAFCFANTMTRASTQLETR